MFAPHGYTAVPQVDEDEEDHLATSYEQRRTAASKDDMAHGKLSTETEDSEKERVKRNVRFDSRSVEDKQETMSKPRRLCFVVSLMICTLTIFVFAFTLPCKGASCNVTTIMPTTTNNVQFHGNWSISFPGHSTNAGIAFHESSQTRNGEIVVSYKQSETGYNREHKLEDPQGLHVKAGLLSLSEDEGDLVWLYNASDAIKLIKCQSEKENFETCLIENSGGDLQLVDPNRNQIIWSTPILIGSISPSIIMIIADCDGDGVEDILLSYDQLNTTHMVDTKLLNQSMRTLPGQIQVISGRSGHAVGGRLTIPQTHLIKRVSLHSTRQSTNILFILTIGMQGHLKVISIQKFYKKLLDAKSGVSQDLFHNSSTSLAEDVSLSQPPVIKDLNQDFVDDIVLVTLAGSKHSLTAVDGGKLKKMWRITFGSRKISSQPVIGHFNDDDIPDILVVLEDQMLAAFNQSLIQILDGQNGNILWSRKLTLAKNTSPLSASIGHKSDVFLLWIKKEPVQNYAKIFPTEAPKNKHSSRPTTHHALADNITMTTTRHQSRQRRDVHSSHILQSRQKIKSSIREMEEELDSLVDEVNKQHHKLKVETELATLKSKKRKTLKLLENMLKRERPTAAISTGTNTIGVTQSTSEAREYTTPLDIIYYVDEERTSKQITSENTNYHDSYQVKEVIKKTTVNPNQQTKEAIKKTTVNPNQQTKEAIKKTTVNPNQLQTKEAIKKTTVNPNQLQTKEAIIKTTVNPNQVQTKEAKYFLDQLQPTLPETELLPQETIIVKPSDVYATTSRSDIETNSNDNSKNLYRKYLKSLSYIRNYISKKTNDGLRKEAESSTTGNSKKEKKSQEISLTQDSKIFQDSKFLAKNTSNMTLDGRSSRREALKIKMKTANENTALPTNNTVSNFHYVKENLPNSIKRNNRPLSSQINTSSLEPNLQNPSENLRYENVGEITGNHSKTDSSKYNQSDKLTKKDGVQNIYIHKTFPENGTQANKDEMFVNKTNSPNAIQEPVNGTVESQLSINTESGRAKSKYEKKVLFTPHVVMDKMNRSDSLVESNLSFKALEMKLKHEMINTPTNRKSNESSSKGHTTQKIQQLDRPMIPKVPDTSLLKGKKNAARCTEGPSFALIAIFPKSSKNSFSVISQEDSFRGETAANPANACVMYWPAINSNPILRDVDKDGFFEIFYVVNYGMKGQHEATMKVKKFTIRSNWKH